MKKSIHVFFIFVMMFLSCKTKNSDTYNSIQNKKVKLYKVKNGELLFWEITTNKDKTKNTRQGIVGSENETQTVVSKTENTVEYEVINKRKEGYKKLDKGKTTSIEIEYTIDGFGTDSDLDKRYKLENRLDNLLRKLDLGSTNGGSSGSGTMEVGCTVYNKEIAKELIENNLKNTEFGNYSRIY